MKRFVGLILSLVLLGPLMAGTVVVRGPVMPTTSTTLLLDSIGTSPKAAYSVARKLRAAYAGSALRVRRASDSTEQDIGFVSNALDTSSLATFCSGTDGFVVTLYDQAGSFNLTNATTTQQPAIVSAGTVMVGSASKPRIYFDGGSKTLVFGTTTTSLPATYITVVSNGTTAAAQNLLGLSTNGSTLRLMLRHNADDTFEYNSGVAMAAGSFVQGTYYVICVRGVTGASDSLRINANSATVGDGGDNAGDNIRLGLASSTAGQYNFHEWVIFAGSLSSGDEDTIRTNQTAFYSIP